MHIYFDKLILFRYNVIILYTSLIHLPLFQRAPAAIRIFCIEATATISITTAMLHFDL